MILLFESVCAIHSHQLLLRLFEMPAVKKNPDEALRGDRTEEVFDYPTGMVWCPMKMSGMAILRCARLQKELGCGTRRDLQILKATRPERFVFLWPWLRRGRECPQRATDKEVRELLHVITPLKLVQGSKKDPRVYKCGRCGAAKSFGARQCRRCWLLSTKRSHR